MNNKVIIGIDARMCGIRFTGIGRLASEIIKKLPNLLPDFQFIIFVNSQIGDKLKNTKNTKIVIADEKIYSIAEQTIFLKKLHQANCDHVLFLHFNVPLLYNRSYSVIIHDLTLFDYPGKKMNRWWHRLVFHAVFRATLVKAKQIITVSDYTKKELIKRFHLNSKKINTIHNAIDAQFLNQLKNTNKQKGIVKIKQKYNITKPYFLYTGVWREHKNLPRMIEAFAILKNKKLQANLVITGNPDPFDHSVPKTIQKFNLKKNITLTGLVSDHELKLLFQGAQVFIFPSLAEGFGIPPLEAMALGIPVCSSNATSLPEICDKAAIYFDPYNIPEMSHIMKKVFVDNHLRQQLINQGYKNIKRFSWQKTLNKYKKILQKTIKT